jgi:hypothetical protein
VYDFRDKRANHMVSDDGWRPRCNVTVLLGASASFQYHVCSVHSDVLVKLEQQKNLSQLRAEKNRSLIREFLRRKRM